MTDELFDEDGVTVTRDTISESGGAVPLASIRSLRPRRPLIPGGMHIDLIDNLQKKWSYWFSTDLKAMNFIRVIRDKNDGIRVEGHLTEPLNHLLK